MQDLHSIDNGSFYKTREALRGRNIGACPGPRRREVWVMVGEAVFEEEMLVCEVDRSPVTKPGVESIPAETGEGTQTRLNVQAGEMQYRGPEKP